MNLIVYFPGLDKSTRAGQIDCLNKIFSADLVLTLDYPMDPYDAIRVCSSKINNALISNIHSIRSMVFIGFDLGAWLAAELASEYDCNAILVDPIEQPAVTLEKFGIEPEVRALYMDLYVDGKPTFVFSDDASEFNDADFKYCLQKKGKDVRIIPKGESVFQYAVGLIHLNV